MTDDEVERIIESLRDRHVKFAADMEELKENSGD
jgi:hypothetical protein